MTPKEAVIRARRGSKCCKRSQLMIQTHLKPPYDACLGCCQRPGISQEMRRQLDDRTLNVFEAGLAIFLCRSITFRPIALTAVRI